MLAALGMLAAIVPVAGRADVLPALIASPVPGISVVLFHQVSDSPVKSATGEDNIKHPWVGVAEFDRLLTQFERDGYHFVTPEMAEAFYLGELPARALPEKPLAVTFDDGWANAYENATGPMLRHHVKAAMYFEGILTDTRPLRLSTAQLKKMLASGAWTLQSHGWKGHSNIVTSADGDTDPYWYANLQWLPEKKRLETPSEFEERVYEDLAHFRTAFEKPLGIRIDSFAYPSGEHGQNVAYPKPALPDQFPIDVHSNASELFPHLRNALARAGYRFAYIVDSPAEYHLVNSQNDIWRLPRIGVGGDFEPSELREIDTDGFELPAMSPDRQYAECGPLVEHDGHLYTASVAQPEIYELDAHFHLARAWHVPGLLEGRGKEPSQIAGIAWDGSDLVVMQNRGEGSSGRATITRLDLSQAEARIRSRSALPADLDFIAGLTAFDGRLVAMTDAGDFYDLANGKLLFYYTLPDAERGDRFAGPIVVGGRLAAYDKRLRRLAVIRSDRTVGLAEVPPIRDKGDIMNLVVVGKTLYFNVWNDTRHALLRYTIPF